MERSVPYGLPGQTGRARDNCRDKSRGGRWGRPTRPPFSLGEFSAGPAPVGLSVDVWVAPAAQFDRLRSAGGIPHIDTGPGSAIRTHVVELQLRSRRLS